MKGKRREGGRRGGGERGVARVDSKKIVEEENAVKKCNLQSVRCIA